MHWIKEPTSGLYNLNTCKIPILSTSKARLVNDVIGLYVRNYWGLFSFFDNPVTGAHAIIFGDTFWVWQHLGQGHYLPYVSNSFWKCSELNVNDKGCSQQKTQQRQKMPG